MDNGDSFLSEPLHITFKLQNTIVINNFKDCFLNGTPHRASTISKLPIKLLYLIIISNRLVNVYIVIFEIEYGVCIECRRCLNHYRNDTAVLAKY